MLFSVVGVEHVPELVYYSTKCVKEIEFVRKLMEEGKLMIIQVCIPVWQHPPVLLVWMNVMRTKIHARK